MALCCSGPGGWLWLNLEKQSGGGLGDKRRACGCAEYRRDVGILYKLIVAALPIAVSHNYRPRVPLLGIRAVDAEPGRAGLGGDLFSGRLDAGWPLNKSVPFSAHVVLYAYLGRAKVCPWEKGDRFIFCQAPFLFDRKAPSFPAKTLAVKPFKRQKQKSPVSDDGAFAWLSGAGDGNRTHGSSLGS